MKWKPICSHAIESNCKTWRISKAQLSPGQYRYALHKHGGEALEYSDDSASLMEMASEKR